MASNAFAGAIWNYTLDPNAQISQFILNEFLASNSGDGTNAIRDENGDASDWIEIYNPNAVAADIGGWFLTDDPTKPTQWKFPPTVIPGHGYLVVFAEGPSKTNGLPLHTSFSLSASGEYLGLYSPQTNPVSEFVATNQTTDVSFGRDRVNPNLIGYFTIPTPGAANATTGSGFASDVHFSRDSGVFTNSFQLTLTVDDTNSVIRYVVVSAAENANIISIPTTNSTLYTGPITVNTTMEVRARAFPKTGNLFPGTPHTESFIMLGNGTTNFASTLPIVVIHTVGATTLSGGFPSADNSVIIACFDTNTPINGTMMSSFTSQPVLVKRAGINLRGSSTQGFPKSSYAVELWDDFNVDEEAPMFDLPKESDWVLYSPNQFDLSLMHNPLLHTFAQDMGHYSSRYKFVEVFFHNGAGALTVNTNSTGTGMGDYWGIYVLEEKVKRDGNRLDIDELQPQQTNYPAITGGYLLKIDRKDDNERSFSAGGINACDTTACQGLIFQDPDGLEMITPSRIAQSNYIRNYINFFYNAIQGATLTNATGTNHYSNYLDIPYSLDIHLANLLTCNVDGYRLSGYLYKPRNGKLRLGPLWDCDRGQGTSRGDGRSFNPRCWQSADPSGANGTDFGTDFFQGTTIPGGWFGRLFADLDLWQTWIDRYQDLRSSAFDTNHIVSNIDRFANIVREAQPRESRRWGGNGASDTNPRNGVTSALHSGYTHTFNGTYQGEVDFQKRWYIDRINFLDTNFLGRPVFTITNEGLVTNGAVLAINDVSGKPGTVIFYTLNGTDPRGFQGSTNPAAILYTGPITITNNVRVRARAFNPNHSNMTGSTQAGSGGASRHPLLSSKWSGDLASTYYVAVPQLAVTEIMFHPENPPAGNTNDPDNYEYIELKNIGTNTLNLIGYKFTNGIDFTFTGSSGVTSLAPGDYVLVVKSIQAFTNRYGAALLPRIAGEFGGNLDNTGERITLVGAALEVILDFEYSDVWQKLADGTGFSLVLADENSAFSCYTNSASWRRSSLELGSPGASDPGLLSIPTVIVSEALTHTDIPFLDTVELQNLTSSNINITGWYLSDSFDNPKKYQIQSGAMTAGGFILFNESQFNDTNSPTAFALGSEGDDIYLFSATNGLLSGYYHGFNFGAASNGVTFVRYVTSDTNEEFVASATNSLGFSNSLPRVGPIVISEIYYHPPEVLNAGVIDDNKVDEFIELHNITGSSVPLYDATYRSNTWHLTKGADFVFPTNVTVPANGYVLVVNFDPATNSAVSNAFKTKFGVPAGVPLFGPYGGKLDNSNDVVKLSRPDAPNPSTHFVPYIQVDRVHYYDTLPWPEPADGFGPSLQRILDSSYGNDPTNWVAGIPRPGQGVSIGTPPQITQQPPANVTIIENTSTNLAVVASGTPPLNYQWRFNGGALPDETNATLNIINATTNQQGVYTVAVFNGGGAVVSISATVSVRALPKFVLHPQSENVVPGTNMVLKALATGDGPISYQWRFEGVDIPGATDTNLPIANVQLEQAGAYDVVATDSVGSSASLPATIIPLIKPFITNPPTALTVVQGENATFTVGAGPAHPLLPLTYRWLMIGAIGAITNNTSSSITVFNCRTNGSLRLSVNNLAGTTNISSGITVTVLKDFDGDGIPDIWEAQYGMNTNNAADALLDPDGDGMNNHDEFRAGTNPTNALSVLQVALTATNRSALQFTAQSNITYVIQFSTSLSSNTWDTISNVSPQNTPRTIVFPDNSTNAQRYYRVVVP
jgi:hypothetical protein